MSISGSGNVFSPVLESALRVAASAHRNQLRKGSEVPYVTHPAAVALILARAGFVDDEILAAAVLHDVVEDTELELEHLAGQFSARVLDLVRALTEAKAGPDGRLRPWEQRKAEHLRQIAQAPLEARAIALADKLHNLRTMQIDLRAGGLSLSAFRAPADKLVWYYGGMIEAAAADDERLRGLAAECRAALYELRTMLDV